MPRPRHSRAIDRPDRLGAANGHSTPLSQYGLDSVYAFSLCGDIEDLLDIRVDPTLVWDYRTVDALTDYLSEKVRLG